MIKYQIKMKIIENKLKEYLKASKKEKGIILNHLTESLDLSREQVIRNFKKLQLRDSSSFKEGRGRKIIYNNEVNSLLKDI
jgi:predicted ArsR family transcriptional regulator